MLELELTATPDQQEVINSDAKRICLMAGRRWGKTIGVTRNRVLVRCLKNEGFKYFFGAPSYAQCREEFESIANHPALADYILRANLQPFPKITFRNGSTISYRSLDRPHLIRGGGFHEAWIDELQDVNETAYDAVIVPMVVRMTTICRIMSLLILRASFLSVHGVDFYSYCSMRLVEVRPNDFVKNG